jgi:hypothetical protein
MKKRVLNAASTLMGLGLLMMVGVAASPIPDAKESKATFTKDVAPILYRSCVECHRAGEVAPMSLLTYEDVRPWARSIKEKVVARAMPPWFADPKQTHFENDRRLSDREINTVVKWVDAGAPKGEAKDLPPAPKFVQGWTIGKPDVVLSMKDEVSVPTDGVVPYKYFIIPTNFTEDKWIEAVELRPGNRGVVHHIIAFVQEPGSNPNVQGVRGNVLGGTAPGDPPSIFPAGTGKLIKAGANIVFQMHYTPNGEAARDRSSIGLIFAKGPIEKNMMTAGAMNVRFVIPPGDPNHEVKSSWVAREDVHLHSLLPHMHVRGKDFTYTVTHPDGRSEVILHVPKYDFNWQLNYKFKQPFALLKGSRIDCVAHFDNSTNNKYNPDPAKEVRWGDQTWEEMMIGWFSYTRDAEKLGKPVATGSQNE